MFLQSCFIGIFNIINTIYLVASTFDAIIIHTRSIAIKLLISSAFASVCIITKAQVSVLKSCIFITSFLNFKEALSDREVVCLLKNHVIIPVIRSQGITETSFVFSTVTILKRHTFFAFIWNLNAGTAT